MNKPFVRCFFVVAGLLSLLLGLVASPSAVHAHALLVRSLPVAGAELVIAPATIELWFSEPLEASFSYAYLVDGQGQEISRDASLVDTADPFHLILTPAALPPGIYTVVYHTLSQSDGHEWLGSFPLTVLNADGSRPNGGPSGAIVPDELQSDTLPIPLKVASRWFSLLGAMGLAGVIIFRQLVIGRRPAQATATTTAGLLATVDRCIRVALILGMGAVFIGAWLQVLGQMMSLGGAPGGATIDLFFQTRAGLLLVARQLLVGALLLLTIVTAGIAVHVRAALQWVALVLTLGLLATFAVGSHAAAVAGSAWAILGDFVHLTAAAVWFGGLGLLAAVLWQWRAQPVAEAPLLRQLVQRFSALATLAVFVLFVTGLFSTLVQLHTLALLWTTAYGRLLLFKIALVLAVLGLAWRNHQLVRRPSTVPPELTWTARHYPRFARQVWGESWLGLGLMVVVAMLVQTPIPQPAAIAPPPPPFFETILTADDLTIHLQISPNQVGDNRYITHLYHADGSPIGDVQLVRLSFVHQTAALGQANLDLVAQGGDFFAAAGAYQNQAGPWEVAIYVRRRGLDDLLTKTIVEVPAPVAVTVPARDPWQNPVATLPGVLVAVAGLAALGLLPFLWRYALRHD